MTHSDLLVMVEQQQLVALDDLALMADFADKPLVEIQSVLHALLNLVLMLLLLMAMAMKFVN